MPDSPAPPSSKRRRGAAILLGIVAALLLGELGVRLLVPDYAPRKADYAIAPLGEDPPTWVYRPGSRVVFEWDGDPLQALPPGARMEIPIDAAGLRGPLPAPGEPCVVVLGDSFTFGEGVEEDATFVGRLRKEWSARGVRLVNAGVAGHGTIEEAARLDGLLRSFQPRAVLLVFVPNDAIPWQDSSERGTDLLNVEAGGGSRLVSLVRSVFASRAVEDWYLSYYTGASSEHWARSRFAIDWMARTCAERGVRFGVAAFPLMHRLGAYPLTPVTDLVRGAAEASHVPFLDLTPAFAGRDAESLWCHPADRHPNARAHAIAADALAPFVAGMLE